MAQHVIDQITLGALVIVRDKMMAQQAAGRKVYRLEVGDTSFDTPEHIRRAINEALETGKTHYPPSTGLPALREAMLTKVRDENCLPIQDADHIVVTIGGMHGLYMAFCALLGPGDEVILPDPMWSEIAELIRRTGGVPVPITLRPERDFLYDPADIEAAVTPRTRAIYINTPHNPSASSRPKRNCARSPTSPFGTIWPSSATRPTSTWSSAGNGTSVSDRCRAWAIARSRPSRSRRRTP